MWVWLQMTVSCSNSFYGSTAASAMLFIKDFGYKNLAQGQNKTVTNFNVYSIEKKML